MAPPATPGQHLYNAWRLGHPSVLRAATAEAAAVIEEWGDLHPTDQEAWETFARLYTTAVLFGHLLFR